MQVPLFKKEILLSSFIWNYFYLFLLSLSLFKSTAFTLFWFSVHFFSWRIASLSGQLSPHLWTTHFSYMQIWAESSKVTCRYNIPILPGTLTEMKCLSWACASSQRSPPPSSRPPLSLHCFPFALTLLSCSHWAKVVCLMPLIQGKDIDILTNGGSLWRYV